MINKYYKVTVKVSLLWTTVALEIPLFTEFELIRVFVSLISTLTNQYKHSATASFLVALSSRKDFKFNFY